MRQREEDDGGAGGGSESWSERGVGESGGKTATLEATRGVQRTCCLTLTLLHLLWHCPALRYTHSSVCVSACVCVRAVPVAKASHARAPRVSFVTARHVRRTWKCARALPYGHTQRGRIPGGRSSPTRKTATESTRAGVQGFTHTCAYVCLLSCRIRKAHGGEAIDIVARYLQARPYPREERGGGRGGGVYGGAVVEGGGVGGGWGEGPGTALGIHITHAHITHHTPHTTHINAHRKRRCEAQRKAQVGGERRWRPLAGASVCVRVRVSACVWCHPMVLNSFAFLLRKGSERWPTHKLTHTHTQIRRHMHTHADGGALCRSPRAVASREFKREDRKHTRE